ncbi:MAG: hypothetical protein COU63_04845 [Candidatus Pacebacteria bacterium CG10_big_fil_rev_8_21_14_0_10_36_11]|nr:hypothetical protein [Candidatus Pacearchaeota archaeon]OIP73969.1 MAG: hypothetical protein AUK08_01770 [Candidatus Pacebacteria bacterium CG2_30_36_39]PIR64392.1 MAG: hypothetical protein COU63_04845 [Candidatus Pacebacteria bacterium CG10_big_fil_rev_8_21_14_0_10_36_11]PJC42783.1 MAG: hypothetical protein CO040_02610 [Candidatus Pacebacteria bacterium CG_4_9_14_0_2_um_filter_36_8]
MENGVSGAKLLALLEEHAKEVEVSGEKKGGDIGPEALEIVLSDAEELGPEKLQRMADLINSMARKDGMAGQPYLMMILRSIQPKEKKVEEPYDPFA